MKRLACGAKEGWTNVIGKSTEAASSGDVAGLDPKKAATRCPSRADRTCWT